jgi:hypothetical protein
MEWEQIRLPALPITGWDPYIFWAVGPGKDDFQLAGVQQSVPLLIRWNKQRLRVFLQQVPLLRREALNAWNRLTGGSNEVERLLEEADEYRTRFIPLSQFMDIFTKPVHRRLVEVPDRITLGPPLPITSAPGDRIVAGPVRLARSRKLPHNGKVVVGIIDDGLAFGHERFRDGAASTRIEYVWLQDGPFDGGASGFMYGREINKEQIDAWLNPAGGGAVFDEDTFYRRAGIVDFSLPGRKAVAPRASHGTHVMDLACGGGPGEDPERRIVCVQLPVATTADSSGSSLAPYVIDAVKYIRNKAQAIAGSGARLPVVINLSYGMTAGPHDGTHEIEVALDTIVSAHNKANGDAPMQVVLPSGNSHLARVHARISFKNVPQEATLTWRVLPDDLTPSFLEVWLPTTPSSAPASRIAISIVTPAGLESPALVENDSSIIQLKSAAHVLCEARYHFHPVTTRRGMFLIALQPTHRLEPSGAKAPFGTWKIKLKNLSLPRGAVVEAWVQRDDTPFGYAPRGRQSFLEDECYERFDYAGREIEEDDRVCCIQRSGTINTIATGKSTVVIGGLLSKELRPPRYSAGGPVTTPATAKTPHREGPDALTVSDNSVAKPGVLAAGTRSGSVVSINGTSVAAPQITRWIAGELANGREGNGSAVRKLAKKHESQILGTAPAAPLPKRGGAGRIRLRPINLKERDR